MSSTTPSPEPRADLRTLATVAAHDVDCPDGPNCGDELTTDGRYGRYADAVLAAVLPEFRRMVLAEAVDELRFAADHIGELNPDNGLTKGLKYGASRVRRLAAAAPPAGLSAPVPAENAPAVPEEADGQVDYHPGTPEERARYWKQRAETAWERGDEDALLITRLVRDQIRLQTALYWDVIEAAKAWREAHFPRLPDPELSEYDDERALIAAVDALSDAGTDQTEGGHG